MSDDANLERRLAALERVLQSELPEQLHAVWSSQASSCHVTRLPTDDPLTVLELRQDVHPRGLRLRLVVNHAYTVWEREVLFSAAA